MLCICGLRENEEQRGCLVKMVLCIFLFFMETLSASVSEKGDPEDVEEPS